MEYILASYPRSGNTFFHIVLKIRYGYETHSANPLPPEWTRFKSINEQQCSRAMPFEKTHRLPDPQDTRPAIYLVRDGRDALISYAHFHLLFDKKMPPQEITTSLVHDTLRDLILETRSQYGTWSQNVEAWMARSQTVVVRYEDLIADPAGVVDRALAGIGMTVSPVSDYIPSFAELKQVNAKFFRRGIAGSWRDEFPPELLELFWQYNGATMERLGYRWEDPPRPASTKDSKPRRLPASFGRLLSLSRQCLHAVGRRCRSVFALDRRY